MHFVFPHWSSKKGIKLLILAAPVFLASFFAAAHESAAHHSARDAATWITLGEAVHGGFGSYIALGIRIGEDALIRLGAQRREVEVFVTEGKEAPCACVADGVMLATSSSPGQRSLTVMPKSTDGSFMALVEVRNRKSNASVTYRIPFAAMAPLARMNPNKSPAQRYDMVMASPADQLYTVSEKK